jgi:hypothetical protein
MESWIFQYSLGEQQFPELFRFNLPQMIRQQYPVDFDMPAPFRDRRLCDGAAILLCFP